MRSSLIVERGVESPMRDGTVLRADVYRPSAGGPFPVLLERTPYGKEFAEVGFALIAAERGYAVVIQDTRGRWSSDGQDYPFVHEADDGYDSVAWAAAQPWSSGRVGMFGGSYVGYTQWAAASTQPPALVAIAPAVSFTDPHDFVYHGGALALAPAATWALAAGAQMAIMRHPGHPLERLQLMGELVAAMDGISQGRTLGQLPLQDLPLVGRGGLLPLFADLLAHPPGDEYWARAKCSHEQVRVPTLQLGGWYDVFAGTTVRDFAALSRGDEPARHRLVMGPWTHGNFEPLAGEVDFGLQAAGVLVMPDEILLRWFDAWLKGAANGLAEEPPVRIFVMGANGWRNEREWPLARTRYTPWYLHSGGAANTLEGNGTLDPVAPGEEPPDVYVYDPHHPVPTRGGGLCCWNAGIPAGAFDQREVERRPDVLVFTSSPLERDLEVTGPVRLHLWAATSAADTDFTAKLVDVGPCGYARNVQDGIVRARYREGLGMGRPVTPGEAYEYVIDLAATSNLFQAGHRIRIEISSSNFPRFDRNLNTGEPLGEGSTPRPATQTILHDAAHPSHVVLPVIPAAS